MAKVKIQGHASGTGILTVTAPNTSSDRTITLPDETATLSTFDPDGAVTINDTGADVDFRIESNSNANRFFIDGGSNSGEGAVIVGHNASLGQHRVLQVAGTTPDTSGMEMFKYSANSSGPTISMSKSRGGSIGSATVVADDDIIGTINWFADDGTDLGNYVALISAAVDGTPGTDDTPGRLVFSTTADGGNSATERMRIDSSGNVEIASSVNPRAVKLYTKGNADIMDGSLVFSKPDSGTYNWRVLPNNITTGDLTFQVTSDTNTNETTQASTFVTKLQLTADGRGVSQFTAKAWVNFNGTGTPAIRDSHNVGSLTDNGTGIYSVNFTNHLADGNFCSLGNSTKGGGSASASNSAVTYIGEGRATSYVSVETYRADGSTARDSTFVNVAVFGD